MVKGVIDRIVDDRKAVILIEDSSDREQIVTDKTNLPESVRYADCLIQFDVEDDEITNLKHLKTEEKERKKRMQRKFDRLSSRLSEE